MKTNALMSLLAVALCLTSLCVAQEAAAPAPKVQVALLLDTSNSMDGLIEQAKAQLWTVVNEFIAAERDGRKPDFQVALYEYGKPTLGEEDGYVRQILPLTTDLDRISQELFALTTNGGDEYCGTVIRHATQNLGWSSSPDDLKTIFIAGNEPFTQGKVDYHEACPEAIAKGITVNTIFCGNFEEGVNTQWRDGAVLADGAYTHIEQDREAVHIAAPQDDDLARLGQELNSTYIPFGSDGARGASNQAQQDANAVTVSEEAQVQRAVTKGSLVYNNASWDLVDAVKLNEVKLTDVDAKDLPETMRGMSPEERAGHVSKQTEERERIQKRIAELGEARKAYVAEEIKKLADKGENTLQAAMIKAVHELAAKKNLSFPEGK